MSERIQRVRVPSSRLQDYVNTGFSSGDDEAKAQPRSRRKRSSRSIALRVRTKRARRPSRARHQPEIPHNVIALEELSTIVIKALQTRGPLSASNLSSILMARAERIQLVLDVLVTTPLINKAIVEDARRGEDEVPVPVYMYRDGKPLQTTASLASLSKHKAKEQRGVAKCAERLKMIKAELSRPASESDPRLFLQTMLMNFPALRSDPLYKMVFNRFALKTH